ncbi:MAG TPA: PilZ domain-containing protein [Pyrinomonadaceae bacterium]|nr:PilZ domain-containing protein [Pyrinomonadaceae bacterium]
MDRRDERTQLIAEIILESSAGGRSTRISDLSMGGCYIESINNFRKDEAVTFDLKNSGGDTLRFTGNVAYILEGFGFGLTFTNIGPQHMEFLRESLPQSVQPATHAEDNILEVW